MQRFPWQSVFVVACIPVHAAEGHRKEEGTLDGGHPRSDNALSDHPGVGNSGQFQLLLEVTGAELMLKTE